MTDRSLVGYRERFHEDGSTRFTNGAYDFPDWAKEPWKISEETQELLAEIDKMKGLRHV